MNTMRAIERATALATPRLGAEAFDKLRAEGSTRGYDAITAIAFPERDIGAVVREA